MSEGIENERAVKQTVSGADSRRKVRIPQALYGCMEMLLDTYHAYHRLYEMTSDVHITDAASRGRPCRGQMTPNEAEHRLTWWLIPAGGAGRETHPAAVTRPTAPARSLRHRRPQMGIAARITRHSTGATHRVEACMQARGARRLGAALSAGRGRSLSRAVTCPESSTGLPAHSTRDTHLTRKRDGLSAV